MLAAAMLPDARAVAQSNPTDPSAGTTAGLPTDFDDVVAAARAAFEVPGLAIAVVRDGHVLLARGYGVRHLGSDARVDEFTRFGIASNTKVFTAAALAMLVDEGRLDWEDRVQRHLPAFALSDPYVTRELTVRDLLVHRSGLGLGAGDLLWWPGSTLDRPEIVRRLRYVPLATSFRSAYAYDNVLYLVAGELVRAVSGVTWEDFVRERILGPVGMSHSTVRYLDAAESGNVAGTHAEVDGAVVPVSPMRTDNTNPAGGIMSCAADLAKWMNVLLADGALPDGAEHEGGRLFSARRARDLTTLVTPIPIAARDAVLGDLRPDFQGYALGLGVRDYRGRKIVTHTGGLPGYVSRVLMVPSAHLGIAVLTNMESMRAIDTLVYHVVDHALGHAGERDWLAIQREAERRARDRRERDRERRDARRAADSTPSLPLERYAGTYRDAWCGDVVVGHDDAGLSLRFADTPMLQGPLEHWQYDTFVARWTLRELRADAFVTFVLGPDGAVTEVRMAPASPEVDFSFDFQHLLLRPVAEAPAGARDR